LNIWGQATH